jgi:hypothetical protein
MKKHFIEEIKVNSDNDKLAISKLSRKPLGITKIETHRTGLNEWTKKVFYYVYSDISYDNLVKKLIREKYSADDEYKLHREAFINGLSDEFHIYNAYVEQCKLDAKAFIEERERVLNE